MNNLEIKTVDKEEVKRWLENTGMSKKLTIQQVNQFIDTCILCKLNPFKREAYAVPYGATFNILVGYEVYIKRAEGSGQLEYWNIKSEIKDKKPIYSECEIKRKDQSQPFIKRVYFDEYKLNTPMWISKPITMLEKVATATAFRLAFPNEVGGLPYTSEEYWKDDKVVAENVEATIKNETNLIEELKELLKNSPGDIRSKSNLLIENNITPKNLTEEKLQQAKELLQNDKQ